MRWSEGSEEDSLSERGFFLVMEGLDGVGKSHLVRQLEATMQSVRPILRTEEPHMECCAGRFLRQVLARERQADVWTQSLAFAANRADHNSRIIGPFLREHPDGLLVCDRYYLSSLVYQARDGVSFTRVLTLNEGARRPDLTIFLDAPPDTLIERQRDRREGRELYDGQLALWRSRYEGAIAILRERGERIIQLDAAMAPDALLEAVLCALKTEEETRD